MNTTKKRLLALEQKRFAAAQIMIPQIVPYDASTGLPLVPPDPTLKQIWLPSDGQDLQSIR